MTLREFRERLQGLAGGASESARPFVCEGDPRCCNAILVGFNPASTLPFWRFWDDARGFDKQAWFACYNDHFNAKAIEAGKRSPQLMSNTRKRIELIVKTARPAVILETNLYAHPSKMASDLKKSEKRSEAFEFLLHSIEPKIIALHGADASKSFHSHYHHQPTESFTKITLDGRSVWVAGLRHLRLVSFDRAEKLGQEIQALTRL